MIDTGRNNKFRTRSLTFEEFLVVHRPVWRRLSAGRWS